MLILCGPSATGKSEVVKELIRSFHMKKFVTCTTREMRKGEVNGVDYHFLTKDEFLLLAKAGDFVEYQEYNGNFYGTLKSECKVDRAVILEPKGVNDFIAKLPDYVYVVYLDASENVRFSRMIARGDGTEKARERILTDNIVFIPEKLNRIDFIINTAKYDVEETAEMIYNKYMGL